MEVDAYVHPTQRAPGSRLRGPVALSAVVLLAAAALLLSGCPMPEGEPPGDDGTGSGGETTTPQPDPPVLSPGGTTVLETGGVRIDLKDIYWVALEDYYVQPDRAVAIDLRITNLSDSRVDYDGLYGWGVMVTSEGEQIESVEWIGAANTQYFDGATITAGAFIRDTISFDELPADSNPESFQVKAEPPIDGAEEFEIHFDVGEVGEKADS